MRGCEFSREAQNDLWEIWEWIAREDPAAADRLEADIYAACDLFSKQPGLGHRRRDLTSEPVLFWPVRGQYLVIYLKKGKPLKIVRILHGARDVRSEL